MTPRRHFLVSLTLILVTTISARADEVDDYIRSEMQKRHIPAVALAVLKNGSVVKVEGYGLADVENAIPARPDTVFKIGSVSKQFIATGIMLLVQDGKMAVGDKVSKHLTGTPSTWESITVRHLLTHTAGVVREAPGFDPYKVQPDIEVIKTAYLLPLRFQPGEKWEYSNLGYFVLAEIVTKVSGKPWDEFLKERVFAALGMTATRATSVKTIVPKRADGYAWNADKFENLENWPAVRPSGAFLSTVLDLAKWEAALLTQRILTDATKRDMWTPVTLNDGQKHPYGFGWMLNDWPLDTTVPTAVPMISHGGSLTGFRAGYFRWPKQGLAVIILANLNGAAIEALGAGVVVRVAPELKPASTLN